MTIEAERTVAVLWCARAHVGAAPGRRRRSRSATRSTVGRHGPARVAAVLLWAAWTIGLVALLAPRPWGLTALRVVAPAAVRPSHSFRSQATDGGSRGARIHVVCGRRGVRPVGAGRAGRGERARVRRRDPLPAAHPARRCSSARPARGAADRRRCEHRSAAARERALRRGGGRSRSWASRSPPCSARSLHALSVRWLVLVPAGLVVVDPLDARRPGADAAGSRSTGSSGHRTRARRPTCSTSGSAARPARSRSRCTTPQSFPRRRGRHDTTLARRGGRARVDGPHRRVRARGRRPPHRCRLAVAAQAGGRSGGPGSRTTNSGVRGPEVGAEFDRDAAAEHDVAVVARDHLARAPRASAARRTARCRRRAGPGTARRARASARARRRTAACANVSVAQLHTIARAARRAVRR